MGFLGFSADFRPLSLRLDASAPRRKFSNPLALRTSSISGIESDPAPIAAEKRVEPEAERGQDVAPEDGVDVVMVGPVVREESDEEGQQHLHLRRRSSDADSAKRASLPSGRRRIKLGRRGRRFQLRSASFLQLKAVASSSRNSTLARGIVHCLRMGSWPVLRSAERSIIQHYTAL